MEHTQNAEHCLCRSMGEGCSARADTDAASGVARTMLAMLCSVRQRASAHDWGSRSGAKCLTDAGVTAGGPPVAKRGSATNQHHSQRRSLCSRPGPRPTATRRPTRHEAWANSPRSLTRVPRQRTIRCRQNPPCAARTMSKPRSPPRPAPSPPKPTRCARRFANARSAACAPTPPQRCHPRLCA
jgi:hypothetical protein